MDAYSILVYYTIWNEMQTRKKVSTQNSRILIIIKKKKTLFTRDYYVHKWAHSSIIQFILSIHKNKGIQKLFMTKYLTHRWIHIPFPYLQIYIIQFTISTFSIHKLNKNK